MRKKEDLDELLRSLRTPFRYSQEESWRGIQDKIAGGPRISDQGSGRKWWAVAAAVAVLALTAWWLQTPEADFQEFTTGQIETPLRIDLPDGSTAWLNDNSSLSYDAANFSTNRKIELQGLAYFEVKKSSAAFVVSTVQGIVQVLGTSFDVIAVSELFEVSCFSGNVAVNNPLSEVTLGPGQTAAAGSDGRLAETESSFDGPKWMDGEYNYSDKPIQRVLADVERQYDVKITFEAGTERTFTGYFSEEFTLEETLEIICRPMGFVFSVEEKDVRITNAYN